VERLASPEVVMSTTVTSLDQLDLDQLDYDISLSYIVLGVARSAWDRCPSARNARRVEEAGRALDELLDERLAVRP